MIRTRTAEHDSESPGLREREPERERERERELYYELSTGPYRDRFISGDLQMNTLDTHRDRKQFGPETNGQ